MALNGRIETGAMPENTPRVVSLKPGEEFKIPLGYHNGTGTCKAYNLEENTPGNATPNDIVSTFKGYVNGVIINGNLSEMEHVSDYTSLIKQTNYLDVFFQRGVYTDDDSLEIPYRKPQIQVPATEVARVCEITRDKLAHGTRVCDVAGSYSADATAMESDIIKNKVGFKMGQPIVGILKTMDIYNPGFVRNENGSVTFSWNNPANGPYGGIIIRYAWTPEGADNGTILYQGYGSNKTPRGRSSITISNLEVRDYYTSLRSYCGPLISDVVFRIKVPAPVVDLLSGQQINSVISNTATRFIRSATLPPAGVDVHDISSIQNRGIVTWYDAATTTQYWYSNAGTIYLNPISTAMFSRKSFTSLDLSMFNTSKVTNMSSMFANCEKLTSLNLRGWNTSNVTTMWWMFTDCSALLSLDLSMFDTSNVTDMSTMFSGMSSIKVLNLSNFRTPKLINMYGMFGACSSLTSLNVSNFDTSKVTTMVATFQNNPLLASLDLSSFDTSNVVDMHWLFKNNRSLSNITYGANFVNTSLKGLTETTDANPPSIVVEPKNGSHLMYGDCPANKPNWTAGSWNTNGTFIKTP